MDQVAEVPTGKRQIQEYGFREVRGTDRNLVMDHLDMPWLPPDKSGSKISIVPLVLAVMQNGESFYFGSAIRGNDLVGETSRLTDAESEKGNKLFYAEIQRFLQDSKVTRTLDNPRTKSPDIPVQRRRDIYYASNGRGVVRVYFLRMNDINNKPVIIKIAISLGKGSEIDVLSTLTTEDKKTIKKRCLGK